MQKFRAGCGSKMQQSSWAFLAIFLVCCFVVVTKVQASLQTEPVQRQQKSLIELNEDNWRQMFKGEWMVEL